MRYSLVNPSKRNSTTKVYSSEDDFHFRFRSTTCATDWADSSVTRVRTPRYFNREC